ncbi:glycosyltransferase family 4 protein [Marinobacter sp.]|uniref:glycosyltransferase family 4 protein n=1 Tax=Marinobacter sp. TaxID=50741 RepID=UPI003A90D2D3
MKIALIAPSPVPFMIGGAENLWTGWISALNAQPGVEADLIKLPTPERNFWEIVDSYRRWSELELSHFDRVISTKYPAWMAEHPDHHVYLQHKLRGLYDTWPASFPTEVSCDAAPVRLVLDVLARSRGERSALPEIFTALDVLRTNALELPVDLFGLPGALIRQVVHALDDIGLARTAIRRYAAISETVRSRNGYFPQAAEVEVFHHPTLPRTRSEDDSVVPQGAIFTASRLDQPKRLDWVIKAYLAADIETPLVIAGDGPCRAALIALADNHPQIHLVGRLSDAQIATAYQNALFVPFVPDREDYGLITLEALQAGKPVLTCSDCGGVTELVRDGENGLICAPDIPALAAGMRRLATDADLREQLAQRAQASVAHIRWPALAAAFSQPWPRVAVVNTFPIYPPQNGGQVRMFQLYQRLAAYADIRIVNLGPHRGELQQRTLVSGLQEVVVPMSTALAMFDRDLSRQLLAPSGDVAPMLRPELVPEWLAAIEQACDWADVVVACHPYGYPAIRLVWDGPVVYESLNVEADLKAAIFPHAPEQVEAVAQVEGDCARAAPVVFCCSTEDASRMQTRHELQSEPRLVANGVDAASYTDLPADEAIALRARYGLESTRLALFIGSLHGPNIDGLKALEDVALALPEVAFVVLGSVCDAAGLPAFPANVHLIGRVSDADLRAWLAAADVGLNPMISGSGTNLKMLEYAAAGLPVVSTPFGGRGGILEAGEHYVAAEAVDFAEAIRGLLDDDMAAERDRMTEAARLRASAAGDWRAIAGRMWSALCDTGLIKPLAGD